MLDPDEQLAVAAGLREGNLRAWTTLYDGYAQEVWRYVARLLGGDAAVADVVQETFLGAARSARQFDADRGTLASWLFGIAHRQAALHWRRVSRAARQKQSAESAAEEARRREPADPLAELTHQREQTELVRDILNEITGDYARLLVAKYLDEQSLAELAVESGDSVDAVKSKLARARREFRAEYERRTREPTPLAPERTVPIE